VSIVPWLFLVHNAVNLHKCACPLNSLLNRKLLFSSIKLNVNNLRNRIIIWPAPWAGKMNQILCCDWLPKQAKWSYLARSGLPAVSCKKNFPESHIINPLLTKVVRSRWLNIGLILFCEFIDLDSTHLSP